VKYFAAVGNTMLINDLKEVYSLRTAIYGCAMQAIRARYSRTLLGEFWMSISISIYITLVAVVWAFVWSEPIGDYFLYIAVGHVFYTFLTSLINDSVGCLISDARLYTNSYLSPIHSVSTVYLRNVITLFHHLPLVIIVLLIFGKFNPLVGVLALLTLMIGAISLFYYAYLISLIVVRFRDLAQVFSLILNVTFLVTPVIWRIDRVPEEYRTIFLLNPFASLLNISRDFLLGAQVYPFSYLVVAGWFVFGLFIGGFLINRFKRAFVLWL
jgi:lipopolysaccharide transport system permease protein